MAGRRALPAGPHTMGYEVEWQAHGPIAVQLHARRRQQNSFWRWTHAGRAQMCPTLSRCNAARASAVFQACQRGLRILQSRCTLPGAASACDALCQEHG